MFARCVTWLESRGWPAPWRETCSTSTPAHVPRETSASPHAVSTGSGPRPSKPGSAYVPEPVMMPIAMARHPTRGGPVEARSTSSGADGENALASATPIAASSAPAAAAPNSA